MTREVLGTQVEAAPKHVSRKKRCGVEVPGTVLNDSGCTRFVAEELKLTKRPSGPMPGERLAPLASTPPGPIETRTV